jgi:ACDE family multidrug resistance protein
LSTPPAVPQKKLLSDENLLIMFGVTLMSVLGVASITPAFPMMMKDFDVSQGQIGLLITFFTLPGVFLSPVLGVMADRWGRKRILVPSLVVFGVAGAACGLVRDFHLLLALRAVEGTGAAALGSLNTTIIGDMYSGPRRATAMGYNSSVLSIGTASYPAIGGALALLGWYYPFYLPILAVPVGLLVLARLHTPEPRNDQDLKAYLGATWSQLKNIRLIGVMFAGILTFLLIYGSLLTYFTLMLADKFNASSFIIGLTVTAMSLTTAAVSTQLGRINRRFALGSIIIAAFVFYGVAFFLVPLMPSLGLLFIPMLILGAGHGANVPSFRTAVAEMAPIEYRAAVMSVNSMMLRIGQTIGPPLIALLYVFGGFPAVFYGSGVIALLTAAVGLTGRTIVNRRSPAAPAA